MAIDQALLDRAEQWGERWLRLYTWQPHCLSFGRHEPVVRRYDTDRIAALEIDTVRRPTGGRAVWHSHELTYAVAAPCPDFGSLHEAYLEIHRLLVEALLGLGVPAWLAPCIAPVPLHGGACFSQAAGGEVMAGPRKVVGSAQLRHRGALLQHGSILLRDEQHLVARLTKGWAFVPDPFLPPSSEALCIAGLTKAITKAFQTHWPGPWLNISSSEALLQAASSYYPQFRSPAWTWKR
jgi:lipoate-protein ligase A